MTIETAIKKAYLRFNKSTDYPSTGTDDYLIYVEYANMAIEAMKREAKNGNPFRRIITSGTVVTGGTGEDALPSNFLSFIADTKNAQPAKLTLGGRTWREISVSEGERLAQENLGNEHVFYVKNKTLYTFPAMSGSVDFQYMKEPVTYTTGAETDALEVSEEFLIEYILATLYLDDGNLNQYNAHMNVAMDAMDSETTDAWKMHASGSQWGFGM